jgi:hypothetical protein
VSKEGFLLFASSKRSEMPGVHIRQAEFEVRYLIKIRILTFGPLNSERRRCRTEIFKLGRGGKKKQRWNDCRCRGTNKVDHRSCGTPAGGVERR